MVTIFNSTPIERQTLEKIILGNPESISQGLKIIGHNFALEDNGIIDFIGLQSTGQLAILSICVDKNDYLLIDLLSYAQYLRKNQGVVTQLFAEHNINFSQKIKIFLIASNFSEKLRLAAAQFSADELALIKFIYLVSGKSGGSKGIIFKPDTFNSQAQENVSLKKNTAKQDYTYAQTENELSIEDEKIKDEKKDFSLENIQDNSEDELDVLLSEEEKAEFINFDKNFLKGP
ncbi:MAG: hypothetical protein DRP78_06885 [Candidatus Omnitrophota bacterium]|nr:MAG: hypothetical protein DRP78_06885 [Candidatus Omnitrophota bacterium]